MESESSTDEDEIVVESAPLEASSEPVAMSSTGEERRARNIAASVRVNLPTSMARLSTDGAIIEGMVAPIGRGVPHCSHNAYSTVASVTPGRGS